MRTTNKRGSALLAVLWLSAALAAIAFSVANRVRGETDRTSTMVDDVRSYYLATAGIEHAVLNMMYSRNYVAGQSRFFFAFPTGDVTVEIVPEAAKININQIRPEQLIQLLLSLGVDGDRAREITAAIIDWRTGVPFGVGTAFDAFYETLNPSFHARHASFEETEELLSVKGVTPDLYYGTYVRDTSVTPPQLVPRGGLKDCLSVFGSIAALDVNNAAPAAMAAVGVPPSVIEAVLARRPFLKAADFFAFSQGNPAFARLAIGGNSMYTLRATAQLRLTDGRLSDLRRTVSATMNFQYSKDPPVVVMRWYDRG